MAVYSVLIKKCNHTVSVDTAGWSHTVQNHIFEYGLRQKLNDSIASVKADDIESDADTRDEAIATVETVIARLNAGDVRAHRVGATTTVEGLATALAKKAALKVWRKKNGTKVPEKEEFAKLVAAVFDKNADKLRAEAKRTLEVENDLDLDDIEL